MYSTKLCLKLCNSGSFMVEQTSCIKPNKNLEYMDTEFIPTYDVFFYTKQVIHRDKRLLQNSSKTSLDSHKYPNADEVPLRIQTFYQTATLHWLHLCIGMANVFASCQGHGKRRGYSIGITTDTRWSVLAVVEPLVFIFAITDLCILPCICYQMVMNSGNALIHYFKHIHIL